MVVFQIYMHGVSPSYACQPVKLTNVVAKGHHLRLFKRQFHYDLRKYYFGNCIISHWNSLPE